MLKKWDFIKTLYTTTSPLKVSLGVPVKGDMSFSRVRLPSYHFEASKKSIHWSQIWIAILTSHLKRMIIDMKYFNNLKKWQNYLTWPETVIWFCNGTCAIIFTRLEVAPQMKTWQMWYTGAEDESRSTPKEKMVSQLLLMSKLLN